MVGFKATSPVIGDDTREESTVWQSVGNTNLGQDAMKVRRDLDTMLARLAPDGDPAYRHDLEGREDMAAHARSVQAATGLTIPVGDGRLLLGTWQGLFLWEHRTAPQRGAYRARRLTQANRPCLFAVRRRCRRTGPDRCAGRVCRLHRRPARGALVGRTAFGAACHGVASATAS
jgi:hypothetical protein